MNKRFTLIELLVVISIIGILLSLLLPSLRNSRDVAKTALCLSNQKQVITSLFHYSSISNQKIPPAGDDFINLLGSKDFLNATQSTPFKNNLNLEVNNSGNPFFCGAGITDRISTHTKSFQWTWIDQSEILRPWRSATSSFLKTTGGYDTWFTAVGNHLGVNKGSTGWKYSNWIVKDGNDRWPSLLNYMEPSKAAAIHDGVHNINSHLGSSFVRTPPRHRNFKMVHSHPIKMCKG